MPDRRGKDRGRRRVAVLRCARLKDCRHVPASSCFAESVRPKTLPFNPTQPLERARHSKIGHGSCARSRSTRTPFATSSHLGRSAITVRSQAVFWTSCCVAVIRPVSDVAHSARYALHAEGDRVSVVPSPWFQANACVRRVITRFGTRKSTHLTRACRRDERRALERPSRSSLF